MDYVYEFKIPANQPESNLLVEQISLPRGTIVSVAIYFLAGCHHLARVAVFTGLTQLWPTTPGMWYRGDDCVIQFNEDYELKNAWNRLILKGWNEDDTFEHTVTFRFTVLEEKIPKWARTIFYGLFGGGT